MACRVPDAAVRLRSLGSADRGDLDMERALAHMAEEMREADVGVLMNAECEYTHVLQQLYDLQLQKGEYALIRGIRADVSQEAAIFKCNAENRSIIKEKVEVRAAALSASDIPVQIGKRGIICTLRSARMRYGCATI
ncbi:MAG: hypothetical protein V8T10_06080 [Merdibacter sp.]